MFLLISAALSLALGIFVAFRGQERRVKLWFLLLCASAAAVCAGIWVEINFEPLAFTAARINMTAGLMLGITGLLSARAMCGLRLHLPVLLLLSAAVLVNLVTVWVTDAYFTGEIIRYPWGIYVAGDPKFVSNPLLVTALGVYALVNLAINYQRAHPLDKNRTKYLFAAYLFLTFGVLDYLPHFGVDLFGGPVSGITTPLFLGTFAYACLRYRLIEFRTMLGRGSGWALTILIMVVGYALVLEGGHRLLDVPEAELHIGAAIIVFLIWLTLGRVIPDWAQRLLSHGEADFEHVLQAFSAKIMTVLDESFLKTQAIALCMGPFGSESASVVPAEFITRNPLLQAHVGEAGLVETEVLRRSVGFEPDALEAEVFIPLRKDNELLGAIAVGKRADGKMFSARALENLRFLGDIFGMALAHTRSAVELEKRHQLDRYLAPQIVERVLSGDAALIESKRRMTVTIFFSDLKGFSDLADNISPDSLSQVLNEYLSEMADVAFTYGGTVDKFIGDAVMVFFGAPMDAEAPFQAQQCVRMGAAMQRRTTELNLRWRETGLLEEGLTSRMGIHTGEATVGSFGSHNRLEYTAIGSAVNLASRLEGQCKPGHILVSVDTWRLLDGQFESNPRGRIRVKGFADEVEVYEIDPATVATA